VLPWIWLGVLFLILCPEDNARTYLEPELIILTGGCVLLFGGLSALAWWKKSYFAWTWLLPFAGAAFLLLTNINYPAAPNFQNLFDLGLMLTRYFMGEFFLVLGLLFAAQLYRHWLPKASLLWLDGINLVLIILSLLDLRLSQIMGVRLDWRAVEFGANAKMVWREAQPFLPEIAVGLVIILSLYAILIGLWQRGPVTKSFVAGPSGKFLLLTFFLLGFAGDWIAIPDKVESESALLLIKTSPLFAWTSDPVMSKKTFLETAGQLGMLPMLQRPPGTPTRARRNLNVVLIFQESTYNKYLSLFDGKENTQPLLSKYKERMELFPNFFSNYAASMNARFATFTGLYPVEDYKAFTQNRVDARSLFEILHGAGYHCSVFYSSFFDYTGFKDYLQERDIETMYDMDNMPGRENSPVVAWGLREETTAHAIQDQIKEYATNHEPFFLTYVPVAPHNPFDGVPDQFRKFHLKDVSDYTPSYLNELLYLDSCITSILDQLKTSGLLDNTLVIITDDHGEMLGENGGPIGHGWVVTPKLTNIPLIIMDPENPGYHINDTIGSQVDMLPTILDLLGITPPEDQLYQGVSLYSADAQAHRTIYLNSAQQYGVIEGSHFISGNRETGTAASITDLSLKVFGITNNAAHTLFPEIQSPNATSPSISEFDKFQENLLKNYSTYCQMIRN
jgi:Sulfatase